MKLVKLIPPERASFHFGREDLQSTELIFHSDSLFSAICNNLRLLYGKSELEEFLSRVCRDHSLRLSSAFPYLAVSGGNSERGEIYLFPAPVGLARFIEGFAELEYGEQKGIKKIEAISHSALRRLQQGQRLRFAQKFLVNKRFLLTEEDLALLGVNSAEELEGFPFLRGQEEQKVVLNRISSASMDTFYESLITLTVCRYRAGGEAHEIKPGFYFLLDGPLDERLQAAIRLIADEGLGGERSSGKGLFFQVEMEEFEMNGQGEESYMTLALLYPQKESFRDEAPLAYRLVERKGFIYSPDCRSLRRKAIRMFAEGSLFAERIEGEIHDVTPDVFKDHRVYRYGLPFWIGLGVRPDG